MADVIRLQRTVILVGIESVEGVDPTLSGASHAVQIVEGTFTPNAEVLDRKPLGGSLSPKAPVKGQIFSELSCTVEAKTNGNADSGLVADVPEFDALLRAAGLQRTLNVGTDIRYTPRSTGFESVTVYVYFDGVKHIMTGCRANLEFNQEAGQFGTFVFTLMGKWNTPTDEAIPATPNIVQTQPPVLQGACVELGSPTFNPIIQAINLNMNNVISPRVDTCATYGIKGFILADRDPQGSFNPEATLLATHDFWTEWEDSDEVILDTQLGTVTGQIIEQEIPKAVYRELAYGEREAFRTYEITFTAAGSATGDDEVVFIFR